MPFPSSDDSLFWGKDLQLEGKGAFGAVLRATTTSEPAAHGL